MFDYKRADDFLPEDDNTVTSLRKLGAEGMKESTRSESAGNIDPSDLHVFGQFVDHESPLKKVAGVLADPKTVCSRKDSKFDCKFTVALMDWTTSMSQRRGRRVRHRRDGERM